MSSAYSFMNVKCGFISIIATTVSILKIVLRSKDVVYGKNCASCFICISIRVIEDINTSCSECTTSVVPNKTTVSSNMIFRFRNVIPDGI